MSGKLKEWAIRNRSFLAFAAIIGVSHWGWYRLQFNDNFVDASERKDFPLIELYKYMKWRLTTDFKTTQKGEKVIPIKDT